MSCLTIVNGDIRFFSASFAILALSLSCVSAISGDARRFYAGEVLMAEVKPASSSSVPEVVNVPKYYDSPDFGSDTGYALVVVKLDKGRSISSLDYVLSDSSAEYPCLAISDADGVYDVSAWEKKKNAAGKKYSMLFKVRLPNSGKPKYRLKFKLRPTAVLEPNLRFVNVGDKPFTPLSKVPDTGMLGVDPYAKKKAPAMVSNNVKPQKKKPVEKNSNKKNDANAAKWNEMLKKDLGGGNFSGTESGKTLAEGKAVKFKVSIPGNMKTLNLAEIEIFDDKGNNVARKAKVDGTPQGYDAKLSYAVDGNTNGDFYQNSCTHSTENTNTPWLSLSFPPTNVSKIVVWNRTDSDFVQGRILGAKLELFDSAGKPLWQAEIKVSRPKYEFKIGK